MTSNLKNRTVRGASWSLMNQFIGILTAQIIGIVLSRILGPSQFGLVVMVTVLTQFGVVFADLGMGHALVQKKDLSHRDSSTVFWVNCVMGLIIGIVVALCAPAIAAFYGQPKLHLITYFVAASFIINSLGTVQNCLLQKELNFKMLFYVNTLATVFAGVVGITMAFCGWGVWSLVAKLLMESIFKTILLWILSSWRPAFVIDAAALKHVLGFGLPLVGSQSLNYWARNIDNLMIGRMWGDAALGNYNKAYALMLLPLGKISQVISSVMFPSLATIQDDPQRVTRIFLKTIGVTALFGFPASVGIFVIAEPLILALYGPKWTGSIELLRVLSLLGINQSVGSLNGIIYRSQNATMLQFKWGLVVNTICILAILAGLPYGAIGVAISYTITSLAITLPNWMVLGRVIPIKLADILRACAGPFYASVLMGVLVASVDSQLLYNTHVAVRLTVCVIAGALAYVAIVACFRVTAFEDAKQVLSKMRPANSQ